ncbi:hypothetical protein HMPREF0765_4172 [Sphingobacterium spiritivorum ATCC 33300]|uniref:Uncharacterized protein n=1 Tax=Sphingobacterium spiritivorum ATCC 33300 TaxID=525372 RepID=C2G3L6_SPHSI|nr:hypothetical protein HMPREF0765_4172 [Sphingobacterium spiritivorum ATCC 33300]
MRIGFKNYWSIKDALVLPILALSFNRSRFEIVFFGIGLVLWKL